jgi:protein-S-isoprenylcysteine O-methyltransferase Ste14
MAGLIDLHGLLIVFVAAVFLRLTLAAATTFRIVPGEAPPRRSELVSLGFWVMLINSSSVRLKPWLVVAGCIGIVGALALFEWARNSIRGQYFSYVFSNDVPKMVWTRGPFAYIRNPFYASYLLGMASVALMWPSLVRFLVFAGTALLLTSAARHEERKFAHSPLASEYQAYRQRTGRFLPKVLAFRSLGDPSQ